MPNIKDITELRNELLENFEAAKSGKLDLKMVAELNNTAGKVIATAIAQLKYQSQQGTKEKIDFLRAK